MPEKKNWLLSSAGIAAAVIVFISTTLGLWFTIEGRMKATMIENTQRLTLEIQKSATDLAAMHRDDLEVRIRIKKRAVASLQAANQPVPERTLIELDALKDQLTEVKEKWFVH